MEAIQDRRLVTDKLAIMTQEKELLDRKVQNLEGMYRSEYGQISNAKILTEQLRKKELDIQLSKETIESVKKEKGDLVMLVSDLRNQLNKMEAENDKLQTEASMQDHIESSPSPPRRDFAQELELMKLRDENEQYARAVSGSRN